MRPKTSRSDRDWGVFMDRALELAVLARAKGDVPIGALVVDIDGKVIGEAHNEREILQDPTAHAEILALQRAAKHLGSWRLTGCTLLVSLEPCVMCAGALSLSRIDRVVFGASDPKAGATGSLYKIHDDERLNHRIELLGGVRGAECAEILKEFFRSKRS